MTCRECQEIIARADGTPEASRAVHAHLAACTRCGQFALDEAAVAAALVTWEMPPPIRRRSAAAREALVARLADQSRRRSEPSHRHPFAPLRDPAWLAVPGAAAVAAVVALAPAWVQSVAAVWAGIALLLVALVLLYHARPNVIEGESS